MFMNGVHLLDCLWLSKPLSLTGGGSGRAVPVVADESIICCLVLTKAVYAYIPPLLDMYSGEKSSM